MASLNRVELIGHLGADPESRAMPSGKAVANLRMATTEKWKDKTTGEKKEATEWHRVVYFGRIAEICTEYLTKGDMIRVTGKLRTQKYTDKQGVEKYSTEIVGDEMMMLITRGRVAGGQTARQAERPTQGRDAVRTGAAPDDFDDDIPF
jgi:single-strand DNA-binding protein